MTEVEFIEQTQKLCGAYEKSLTEEQMNFWFDNIRAFDVDTYKRAIDIAVTRYKFMPALNEMLDTLKETRNVPNNQKVACKACHGSGYIMYKKLVNGISYDYACQCPCANGQKVAYDGRACQKPSDYYLERAENVFGLSPNKILNGGLSNA